MSPDESLPRTARIRAQADFERAYAQGNVAMDGQLVVHAIRNQLGWSRLGVSVSLKVGSAPVRNRWKRVIREAFRRSRAKLPSGLDLVVRPRRGAIAELDGVQRSLTKLVGRLAKDSELPT
jgi:ribonuclease P protein component